MNILTLAALATLILSAAGFEFMVLLPYLCAHLGDQLRRGKLHPRSSPVLIANGAQANSLAALRGCDRTSAPAGGPTTP